MNDNTPDSPDMMQSAAYLKSICERVASQYPFKTKIELDATDPESPEVIINDWITVVLIIGYVKGISGQYKKIKYSIAHIENLPSHSRDEPDDIDTVVDTIVDSPWQATKEAFMLLLSNDLDNAIAAVDQEEMVKDEESAAALEAHRELFDPL